MGAFGSIEEAAQAAQVERYFVSRWLDGYTSTKSKRGDWFQWEVLASDFRHKQNDRR